MPLLNGADAVFLGDRPVDAVYQGGEKIWPAGPTLPPYYFEPFAAYRDGISSPEIYISKPSSMPSLKGAMIDDGHTLELTWDSHLTGNIFTCMGIVYIGSYTDVYDHPNSGRPYTDFSGVTCGVKASSIPSGVLNGTERFALYWFDDSWGEMQEADGFFEMFPAGPSPEFTYDFATFPPSFGAPSPGRGSWQSMVTFRPSTQIPAGRITITDPYGWYVPK